VLFHLHFAGSRSPEKAKVIARLVGLWHWGCAPAGGTAGGDRGSSARRRAQGCGCQQQRLLRRAKGKDNVITSFRY